MSPVIIKLILNIILSVIIKRTRFSKVVRTVFYFNISCPPVTGMA
jgi:hypothetical protein